MPSRSDALAALLSIQSKPIVKVESAPTHPSTSGYTGSLGDATISRVSDRARRAEAAKQEVVHQPVHVPDAYEQEYYRRQAAEKAELTKKERAAAEKRHVEDCRRAAALRDKADADAHAQRVVEHMFSEEARRQVKHILADCTGEEIQEILRRVDAARMRGFAPAYQTFKDEVRRERRKS